MLVGGQTSKAALANFFGWNPRGSWLPRALARLAADGTITLVRAVDDEDTVTFVRVSEHTIQRPITGDSVLALVRGRYPAHLSEFMEDVDKVNRTRRLNLRIHLDGVKDWDGSMQDTLPMLIGGEAFERLDDRRGKRRF